MMRLGVLSVFLLLLASSSAQSPTEMPAEGCGDLPADVVFIMDSSSSIQAPDFVRQVDFVKGVAALFDIAPNRTQVGVMSFSNWAYLEFHLKKYHSHWAVQAALGGMEQIKGDTNTADAIAFARDVMFQPHNGARRDLPRIAIVLTDGKSNEPARTALEAGRMRAHGIHVFAIGIGTEAERAELMAIAGVDRRVFQVGDFTALQYIKEILAIQTCGVPVIPATEGPEILDLACGNASLADIVFAPAPAGSPDNTAKALAFFREVSSGLDVEGDRVRVGIVPKECGNVAQLTGEVFEDKGSVMERLDALIEAVPGTAAQIKYMRRQSFHEKNGARPDAKRLAIMIVDEGDDLARTKYEAHKLKAIRDVEMFVIGVGKGVDLKKLQAIASEPTDRHVFKVDDYDALPMLIYRVKNSICPPVYRL